MAMCRVDACGAGAHTLCIVYYVAIVIIFCVFERPFAHLDLRLRTCTFFCCFTYYLQLRYLAYCMQTESHWLRMLASAQVEFGAAFSKASARERSPAKQYLWRHFLLFSRRTFAGARFAESSTDGEPGVFYGSVMTWFFTVRAQLSNRTRRVPRHMLQHGRNKQQQLRDIHIHERIYAGR